MFKHSQQEVSEKPDWEREKINGFGREKGKWNIPERRTGPAAFRSNRCILPSGLWRTGGKHM
jgi:hypothetical protein